MQSIIKMYMTELNAQMEEDILKVCHSYGIDVNKERLMQALTDARKFYDEGYCAGKAAAMAEIVRCKDCKHGVWDKDEELWKCVISADWNEEVAEYIGFIEYHEADDFCSYGERRSDNAD